MLRKGLYTTAALAAIWIIVLLSGILTEEPKESQTVTNSYNFAEWTLTKKCSDGTEIYKLSDGDNAIFRGENENDQHWVKLTPGVTPDDYCN